MSKKTKNKIKKITRNTINVIITTILNLQLLFYWVQWDNASHNFPTYLNKSLEYYDSIEHLFFWLTAICAIWTVLCWNGLNNGVKAVKSLLKD